MREILEAIEGEFARYKALADGALAQAPDAQLCVSGPNDGNSLAVLVWHVSGNLTSRFTDFLTTDGEKPWRQRDEEFIARSVTRGELQAKWEGGWHVLTGTLRGLHDEDLSRLVLLRGRSLPVREALLRALAHVSYHVGQIVYLAKALRGPDWTYLSIPPGGSAAYNANPASERPVEHATRLTSSDSDKI
ncbi:MAG: DUF1572 family protein [Gemmatimonadaceae bacterium]